MENAPYLVEYEVADFNGNKTKGYFEFTTAKLYNITNYTAATLENPNASLNIAVNSASGQKDISFMVALYDGNHLKEIDFKNIKVGSEVEELSAGVTVPSDGTTYEIKTFLWDGMKPVEIQ